MFIVIYFWVKFVHKPYTEYLSYTSPNSLGFSKHDKNCHTMIQKKKKNLIFNQGNIFNFFLDRKHFPKLNFLPEVSIYIKCKGLYWNFDKNYALRRSWNNSAVHQSLRINWKYL